MSIKGITQELFVGKTEVNIMNLIGSTTTLAYSNLKKIEYDFASKEINGRVIFYKKTNEEILFKFNLNANDQILKMIDFLKGNVPELPVSEIEFLPPKTALAQNTSFPEPGICSYNDKKEPEKAAGDYIEMAPIHKAPPVFSGGLRCPKCKGHNIDLWSNTENYKITQKTSINLNPLHPLTVFNTKQVKKEKTSAAKVGLGIATLGMSTLVTGTKSKKHNEYYCRDCGNRWIGK